jgi:hypothetical protein
MPYISNVPQMGNVDLTTVAVAGTYPGAPFTSATVNPLPSATMAMQLGQIITAYDTAANAISAGAGGAGEFIWLAVPVSTAVTPGLLYSYTPSSYGISLLPTAVASQAVSGFPICLAINTVASNASSIQYTWFQVGGRGTVLKDAVAVGANRSLFLSGATQGRVRVIGSAFRGFIGVRSANATTVTTTTSAVAVYLNGRPCLTAGI